MDAAFTPIPNCLAPASDLTIIRREPFLNPFSMLDLLFSSLFGGDDDDDDSDVKDVKDDEEDSDDDGEKSDEDKKDNEDELQNWDKDADDNF